MDPERRGRGNLLGVAAYVLVPGERRKDAAVHFRKAGIEALRGLAALARPVPGKEGASGARREKIEIR